MLRNLLKTAATACALTVIVASAPHASGQQTTPAPEHPLSTEAIARKALPALVTVVVKNQVGATVKTGSGFFVAPKRVVTNLHVIAGESVVEVVAANGSVYPATTATIDEAHDLAILDCPAAKTVPILALGDPMRVAVGQNVVAAGSPLGMQGTISTGIVSAKREIKGALVIQTTAPISPGSSGGPLLDETGKAIGVNSFVAAGGQNVNFAHISTDVRTLMAVAKPTIDFSRGQSATSKSAEADPNQLALLTLLAQADFNGTELETDLLGPAHLELIDLGKRKVYVALHPPAPADGQEVATARSLASKFVSDSDQLEVPTLNGLQAEFVDYSFQRSTDKWMFVATPIANLRLGNGGRLDFPYRHTHYFVTSGELKSYMDNFSVYGGPVSFNTASYVRLLGSQSLINQGAFVSRGSEPSLKRLALDLTKNAKTDPERVQALVSFVTEEIVTIQDGMSPLTSPPKNAATTLILRKGNAASKTVLLASLFEQIPIDYLLVYGPNKLWVAVQSIGFASTNALSFDAFNKSWTPIDVTVQNFVPGQTPVNPAPEGRDLAFVQAPRDPGRIVNRFSGVPLSP